MKGDFTRWTYSSLKNYSSVLLQQGRVLLDADWNEQQEIGLSARRALARDLIGSAAGPLAGSGYAVTARDDDSDGVEESLYLAPGHYYVNGILCQLHGEIPVAAQPELGGANPLQDLEAGRYAVYLDVWERHVTAIEDGSIKEKALGGVDHTTRKRVVAQARLLPLEGLETDECQLLADPNALAALLEGTRGGLAASVDPAPPDIDPCIVPPTAGFRGLENQLYRVEVHRSGDDGSVTFKWSRDNGSVVTGWLNQPDPAGQPEILELADLGPDNERGFHMPGLLVELADDSLELDAAPGLLAVLHSADAAARTIELSDPLAPDGSSLPLSAITRGPDEHHPRVRRWDCPSLRRIDEVDVHDSGHDWIQLERGIRIRFEPGRRYRTGDYWMIPARTVDGTIDWSPDGIQLPHGVEHQYACLAVVEKRATGEFVVERDCRRFFPAGSELIHLRYAGGDGQQGVLGEALPQRLSVQVLNGKTPVAGASVRFELLDVPASDGSLRDPVSTSTGQSLIVDTVADGMAVVELTLASEAAQATTPSLIDQRVRATLLDACGEETAQTLVFSAHESQAAEVRYDNAACPPMANLHVAGHETDHVQRALDVLCDNPHLGIVGGDGQEAMPGDLLPNRLVVRAGNGAFPMAGLEIEFRLVDLGDTSDASAESWAGWFEALPPGTSVDAEWSLGRPRVVRVPTDAQGVASVAWRLGEAPGSEHPGVVARLQLPAPYDTFAPGPAVRFSGRWSLASRVAYQPNCALLESEGVSTVQAALDTLCREVHRSSCSEFTITLGDDPQSIFDAIPEGGDARICWQAGAFSVASTIEVRNKGHLTITGAGPGTRVSGAHLNRVLHFEHCGKVVVRDLALDALAAAPIAEQGGIQAALSLQDCAEVEVSRVHVRSAGRHTLRRLAGIEVLIRSDSADDVPVRISDCHIEVGHGQVGLMVIDGTRVLLERNRALCAEAPRSLPTELRVDRTLQAWVGKMLVDGIQFPLTTQIDDEIFVGSSIVAISDEMARRFGLEPEPGRTVFVVADRSWSPDREHYLVMTVPTEFAEEPWPELLRDNPPRRPAQGADVPPAWVRAELRRLRKDLARIAFRATVPERTIPERMNVRLQAFAAALEAGNNVTAGGQGIVVGGRRAPQLRPTDGNLPWSSLYALEPRAPNIRIANNSVDGFVQGIHVGLSFNDGQPTRHQRLRTLRAEIVNNDVVLRIPSLSRERHGLFLGNAHSSRVHDNNVDLAYPPLETWANMHARYPVDGIRLWGVYGPMLHVTGNQLVGPSVGVRAHALNPHVGSYPTVSWRVRENAYVGNGTAELLQLS